MKIQVVPHRKHFVGYKNHSVLYREIMAVCSGMHTKHTNTLCVQNVGFFVLHLDVRSLV